MDRHEFFSIPEIIDRPPQELEMLHAAYWLPKRAHYDQTRNNGERYSNHPRRTVLILLKYGHVKTSTLITAFLHDIIEDTYTPQILLLNTFGPRIWSNVQLLSSRTPAIHPVTGFHMGYMEKDEDKYYAAIDASEDEDPRLVKLADRDDNTTDIETFDEKKLRKYHRVTTTKVLPIGLKTCPRMHAVLAKRCDQMAALIAKLPTAA